MSRNHYIIPKQQYDLNQFFGLVTKIEGIQYEDRGNDIYYFWMEGKSTRGMDFSVSGDRIELRMTNFSNEGDYFVTGVLAKLFQDVYKCKIVDEDGKRVKNELIYTSAEATQNIYDDYNALKAMHQIEEGLITLFCPHRRVHLGKTVFKKLAHLEEGKAIAELEKLIKDINYSYPEYSYGLIVSWESDDGKTIIEKINVLDNVTHTMIDKYEYLMFDHPINQERQIVITNDQLNTILPKQWKLLDDYTVLAPPLPDKDWLTFRLEAAKMDLYDSVFN